MRTIAIRHLKRGQPEDQLAPGESLRIRKGRQKTFALRRTDVGQSRAAILDGIDLEIPREGKARSVDMLRLMEDEGL